MGLSFRTSVVTLFYQRMLYKGIASNNMNPFTLHSLHSQQQCPLSLFGGQVEFGIKQISLQSQRTDQAFYRLHSNLGGQIKPCVDFTQISADRSSLV